MKNDAVKGTEEGQTCNVDGCAGTLEWVFDDSTCCSCHINPPCAYCLSAELECSVCGRPAYD